MTGHANIAQTAPGAVDKFNAFLNAWHDNGVSPEIMLDRETGELWTDVLRGEERNRYHAQSVMYLSRYMLENGYQTLEDAREDLMRSLVEQGLSEDAAEIRDITETELVAMDWNIPILTADEAVWMARNMCDEWAETDTDDYASYTDAD